MKKFFVVFVAASAMSGVLSAAPLDCTTQALGAPNVLVNNFMCNAAGLTFSSFFALNAGGVPNPQVNLVGASVSATNDVNLIFNPQLFPAPGQTIADIDFGFKVDGRITSVDLGLLGNGASVTETVCSAPFAIGTTNLCTGTVLATLGNTSGKPTVVSANFSSTSPVFVFKDINVNNANVGTPGSTAGLSNLTQSFKGSAVPEPISMVLMGSGLLALGLVRRRNRG